MFDEFSTHYIWISTIGCVLKYQAFVNWCFTNAFQYSNFKNASVKVDWMCVPAVLEFVAPKTHPHSMTSALTIGHHLMALKTRPPLGTSVSLSIWACYLALWVHSYSSFDVSMLFLPHPLCGIQHMVSLYLNFTVESGWKATRAEQAHAVKWLTNISPLTTLHRALSHKNRHIWKGVPVKRRMCQALHSPATLAHKHFCHSPRV